MKKKKECSYCGKSFMEEEKRNVLEVFFSCPECKKKHKRNWN